jgi:16S rRNA (cytosine1402-N4)-methyltransferase
MHESVLLKETIEALNLKEDSIVVDCTLGYAGHSSEILKRIPKGKLYAFDQDKIAINYSFKKLNSIASNFEIIQSNFANIKEELKKKNVTSVDAILFDLGVSSPQFDEKERGFSFHQDARLDMRMNQEQALDAHYVVNHYEEKELERIFLEYGEEKYAHNIARKIVEKRKEKEIDTTLELVEIIKSAVPFKYTREKHPARKVFQAIRIEVNNELDVFEKALRDSLTLLNKNGRICVITFHSLEDKICKNIYQEVSKIDEHLKSLPVIPDEYLKDFQIVKTIKPTEEERIENNRARSSKLRVIEKIR